MSSLSDLPEVVGFFSYSREDDESYKGRLSALREGIQDELGAQLGRSKTSFRLWQDKEAIAPGKLWQSEIKTAVEQSVFFIPIVTPRAVNSDYCKFEFEAFLAREHALGRADLVFPILYVPVPALANEAQWRNHPVLSAIARRQYVDWQTFRYSDVDTPAPRETIARFCRKIVEALDQPWLSQEERKRIEEAEAQRKEEEEQREKEAQAKRRDSEEERRRKDAAAAQQQERRKNAEAEAERLRLERDAAAQREAEEAARQAAAAEAERQRQERDAAATREVEEKARQEERRKQEEDESRRSEARPLWPLSRPALVAGSLIGLAVLGAIGVWLVRASAPTPGAVSALSAEPERVLKPKDTFKECTNCPEMIVAPAGSFTMGSPANEPGRSAYEGPQHTVAFARQFAVGRFALTFDEWDACVVAGGCYAYKPDDGGWGRFSFRTAQALNILRSRWAAPPRPGNAA
jgi:TIR domain